MTTSSGPAELMAAAARGDTQSVESLLEAGVNPNVQNAQDETALHLAVRHGHAQAAACLLAYGADHQIADEQGLAPLGLESTSLETLHSIRQHDRRFRKRGRTGIRPLSEQAQQWASELDRRGIIKVSGLVQPNELASLQNDFQAFLRDVQRKVLRRQAIVQNYDEEEHWWPKDRAFVSNNAFKHSTQLVKLCCHETLLEVVDHYLGRPAFVQRGVAMRYLPSESKDHHMFGWHHDLEDQRFKMMVLLTDVGESDQPMSYVVASHKLFHPYSMFSTNQCSLDYCREHLGEVEIYSTIGKAGDVFFFDSNGAHRGNRRLGASIRDAFFVEYTTDKSDIWGGDIRREIFDELSIRGVNPFEWMMSVEKKWTVPMSRKAPGWIETLPHVETWLSAARDRDNQSLRTPPAPPAELASPCWRDGMTSDVDSLAASR